MARGLPLEKLTYLTDVRPTLIYEHNTFTKYCFVKCYVKLPSLLGNFWSNKILPPLGCMILYQYDPFAYTFHVSTSDFLVAKEGL